MSGVSDEVTPASTVAVRDEQARKDSEQLEEKAVEQAGSPSVSKAQGEEEESREESTEAAAETTKQPEGEGNTDDDANPPLPDEPEPTQNEWQAIWAPTHNAYYFYNSRTSETTWVNPLDPASSASGSTAQPQPEAQVPPTDDKPKEGSENPDEIGEAPPRDLSYLNGIDPDLAYLDPTLAVPSAGAKGPVPTFTARFGARSGAFTAMDARRPEHLSESARALRMSSVYFDTEAWERELAERNAKAKAEEEAGVGDKRKRLTKADIERFKEQKKAKKNLRNAWLRE